MPPRYHNDKASVTKHSMTNAIDSQQNETNISICQDLQKDFRIKAWNKSGANLLAVTCYYAQSNFLYARPQLTANDFSVAVSVALVAGVVVGVGIYGVVQITDVINKQTPAAQDDPSPPPPDQFIGVPASTWYLMITASVIGSICGALFILRRLSDWQPVDNIIRTSMPKHLQQEFVNELCSVCIEEQVDPEDLESLIRFAQVEESTHNLSVVIMAFLRSRLKMQE